MGAAQPRHWAAQKFQEFNHPEQFSTNEDHWKKRQLPHALVGKFGNVFYTLPQRAPSRTEHQRPHPLLALSSLSHVSTLSLGITHVLVSGFASGGTKLIQPVTGQ